jgi:peptide/nickel transport system permease protein
MTDETITAMPKKELGIVRTLKAIALLRESPVGVVGAAIVGFWILMALLADLLLWMNIIFPPNEPLMPLAGPFTSFIVDAGSRVMNAPVEEVCRKITFGTDLGRFDCGTFYLGTDHLGRDIVSRIVFGSQTVLIYAPLATLCAYVVGIPMGLAAGYRRGKVDAVLSFIANVILSFPVLVLYILVITLIGASAFNILIAITFASAPGIMRIVRGLTLDLRNREYVFAAETRGEPLWRIMMVEILPNARGPLIVDSMLRLGYVIINIGVLGFLGLGLPPPNPDWGGMINETRQLMMAFPHMAIFPCLAISSLVLGFNLLADALREISLKD